MCAVYRPTASKVWVKSLFGLDLPEVSQDVYPGHAAPIVVRSRREGRLAIGLAQFGMVAPWVRDEKISRHTYNARLETVAEKPSFRDAWHQSHWAIVLADCFYEPCYETGKATRWRIARADGKPMGIAGLWQRWRDRATERTLVSFTMLTIDAGNHPVISRMHKPNDEKRTVVVLAEEQFDPWLGGDPTVARDCLKLEQMPVLVAEPVANQA